MSLFDLRSHAGPPSLPSKGRLPGFDGATGWLNSPPLTMADLRGKVVLVDFWTYTWINWLRTLAYVRAWAEKYDDRGLVVVGVHTSEFPCERDVDNVRRNLESPETYLGSKSRRRTSRRRGMPRDAHGLDVDEGGRGTVAEQRLYQLVRQPGSIEDRTFEIAFAAPDVEAYVSTFG